MYRLFARLPLPMLGDDDGGGGGGNGEPRDKVRASDLLGQYSGDATRMAEKLADALNDNYQLRTKRRDLEAEVTTLRGKQVPEGATVLTGDDAAAYAAYRELGKPDEIKGWLGERETLATEVATQKRDATLRDVAEVAGYKPGVLRRLGGDLEYVLKDATVDGKAVKQAFVKTDAGEKPIADYAAEQWADFAGSLAAAGGTNGGGGVAFPAQRPGGGQPPANPAESYIAKKYGPRA